MQDHIVAQNVVAQAVVLPANTPLSFTSFQAGKLFDFVTAGSIVRIGLKDSQQFLEGIQQ